MGDMGSTPGSTGSTPGSRVAAGDLAAAGAGARGLRLPGWLTRELPRAGKLGIRPADVALTAVVIGAVELSVAVGGGSGAAPLDTLAWIIGAFIATPVLLRRRWPLEVLIACSILLMLSYTFHRRNISPAPLLSLSLYDAALAGYLIWAIVIPAAYMTIGLFVVEVSTHQSVVTLANDFLPSIVVLMLAIMLGEVVRGRRALAAETAQRLRAAQEEREAEAARRVAEERLRIARDLHDTVAHSMATITVQAGSALHLLAGRDDNVRAALTAIRETSKHALGEMRTTLGQLRSGGGYSSPGSAGLDRLPGLRDAVTAAGVPVTLAAEGRRRLLPPDVDQAAYRIVQEALTNVLRHAGPAAGATVSLRHEPDAIVIRVTDDGGAPAGEGTAAASGAQAAQARSRTGDDAAGPSGIGETGPAGNGQTGSGDAARSERGGAGTPGGHGLTGMAERAAAVGGEVTAGPLAGGGFEVLARLPLPPAGHPPATGGHPGENPAGHAPATGGHPAGHTPATGGHPAGTPAAGDAGEKPAGHTPAAGSQA